MTLQSDIEHRRQDRSLLLMTHLICGYPSFEDNEQMLEIMNAAGVALVEFQFPFSEPTADGPLFCAANEASLRAGTKSADCFALMSRAARACSFAPLMMGYYNTIYKMGHDVFCERLAEAGGRGMIVPDLPPEESSILEAEALARDLAPIHLMTPTTAPERLRLIAAHGSGFFYCVARRGVTGAHTNFGDDLDAFLGRCREATALPLAVGFGVSSPEDIQHLKGRADIAVVGTAALKAWTSEGPQGLRNLLAALTAACA